MTDIPKPSVGSDATPGPDPKRIAIVDAYSSAAELPAAFRAAGAEVFHVQSSPVIPDVYRSSFRPADFAKNILHNGDLGQTILALQDCGIHQVVAGTESGVELSEQLASGMGRPTNPVASIALRRNKFAMLERLAEVGIPCARQALAATDDAIRAFCDANPGQTVVKPVDSAGSDGVTFCRDMSKALSAFRRLMGKSNALNFTNDAVVIQEYLDGTEYYVNTVSRGGTHRVAEMWETTHIAANGIRNLLDSGILLPPKEALADTLVAYAFRCLDALDVTDSAAHMEIKMTAEGPKLIELGARLVGGPLSRIARLGIAESQIDLIAKSYCDLDDFISDASKRYQPSRYVAAVSLIPRRSGRLVGYPRLAEVEALESYRETIFLVRPGERLTRTVNDFSYAMMIVLAHPDRFAVERDSRTIRHLDGDDFYDIEH